MHSCVNYCNFIHCINFQDNSTTTGSQPPFEKSFAQRTTYQETSDKYTPVYSSKTKNNTIKGNWEYHYLCNCKVKLYVFSIDSNQEDKLDTIFGSDGADPNYPIQPMPTSPNPEYSGLFTENFRMFYYAGYIFHTTEELKQPFFVKENTTINKLYPTLC